MPAAEADLANDPKLPFSPITKSHILHCSYHYWHPKYRAVTPKARLISLTPAFLDYLRADGIILPPDEDASDEVEFESDLAAISSRRAADADSYQDDSDEDEEDDHTETEADPSAAWPEIHQAIASCISELGGSVAPKMNWSAPKDATWINPTNSMECRSPNDVYLLLKSSDFVTHDLQHAFDGCVDDDDDDDSDDDEHQTEGEEGTREENYDASEVARVDKIPYTLVLRKHVAFNPACEFRCFVRSRELLAICQRDLNHYAFLFDMQGSLSWRIEKFFNENLRQSFPDENFVFDVYIPPPHERVWLVDVNPWAPRTDPLLFSWMELLNKEGPENEGGSRIEERIVRIRISDDASEGHGANDIGDEEGGEDDDDDEVEEIFQPEFRLIRKDDPESYSFNTPQYSAHKLPIDVVEASQSGPGPLRDFAEQWKDMLNREQR